MAKTTNLSNLIVRDAVEADMVATQRIYAHYVRRGLATFEEVPPSPVEMEARRVAVALDGFPWLTAEADGEILGYAYAGPYHKRTAYRHTVEDSIYVSAEARGRGAGRALLNALIGRCEAGPWRQMVAVIGDSENFASIALHRRLGFRPIGVLPAVGFKLGRWIDVVLMQRALGAGSSSPPDPSTPPP